MPISTIGSNSLNQTSDLTINGQTVGKGGGNVATNTAHGVSALQANTSGGGNTALGYQAGYSNQTQSNTTAIGYQAGYTNTGDNELVAVGYKALFAATTGTNNTALGHNTLAANTTGSHNLAVGSAALTANTTGNYNTAIGRVALVSSTTANSNTAIGYNAGTAATGGSNVFIGVNAGVSGTPTTTGTNNTYIGTGAYGANAGSTKEIVIGFNFQGNGSNTCAIGSDNGKIYSNFTINATWTQTSDGRMKTNIQDDSLGLSFINRLRPVKFTWKPSNELEQDNPYYKEENTRDTTTVIHGLIAQEVKAALDAEGVDTFAGWDMGADGIQAISREMFVSPLIKAIQELKSIVDAQATEIAELKAKVA